MGKSADESLGRNETKKLFIRSWRPAVGSSGGRMRTGAKKNRTKFPQSETHRRLVLHSGGIFQSSCVGEPVSSKKRTTTPHFSCCTTRYGSGSRPKFECFVQAGCTINFLFLSSSLMAHFNSKLNTLAALISPPSFRNFFFKSAANSGRL